MLIKNIETKIRLATFLAGGSFVVAVIISVTALAYASRMAADARKSIYILAGNVPLTATQTDMQMNRPVEYRAGIDEFHNLFFSLAPDDKYIDYRMKKAMYLIDQSGVREYNNLKENGYFNSVLSSSSVLTLTTDSIALDVQRKYFRYYGKLKIDRRSSTVIRTLLTEGYLKDIPRSDNNPHGVLICGWKTLENKDLSDVQKNTF